MVATFDHNDNVIDMFVNGPNGRIASYYQNKSNYLYYFISDQLGSTRVVMKGVPPASPSNPYIVAEYYNYYPFGQVAEQYGNYPTSFQWTSKEHDQHGGFDYVYFGSRYYDPKIGAFGSVDKAGQFASGYVYGANNPIIGVDRDGNLFGIDDLVVSAISATVTFVSTGITTGDWGEAAKQGAIALGSTWLAYNTGGAAAGALSKQGTAMYAITAGTVGGAVGGATSTAINQGLNEEKLGGRSFWQSMISGSVGGFAGSVAGLKIKDPIGASVIGGAVGGGVQGSFNGEFGKSLGMGMFSGGLSGVLTNAYFEAKGRVITGKMLGDDAYDTDYAGTPRGIQKQQQTLAENNLMWDPETYDCLAFAKDYHDVIGGNAKAFSWTTSKHYGVSLGRTPYGQNMILSKIGMNSPIKVTTLQYLNSLYGKSSVVPWQTVMNAIYAEGVQYKSY